MHKSTILSSFKNIELKGFVMPVFSIYESPEDYPGKFVARLYNLDQPTEYATLADDLEEIRETLPIEELGLVLFPRSPQDHPTVVESWL